ncbi:MAG TPA: phosphoglycerate mutase family protein [Salinimicrobium sp.]|nr:phosphoglycerate mutase family protein [Salinimicrobium sp.]
MKYILLLVFAVITSCEPSKKSSIEPNKPEEMTTYYFIRHAEKDVSDPANADPVLNEKGQKRAEKWAEVFSEVPLDMIYVSQYQRTRQTAEPIAKAHNISISTYSTSKLNDPDFQAKTKGKTVLVVGHSDINPEFANYIMEEEVFKQIEDSQSGSLYIITVSPSGEKSSQLLYIN